MITEDYVSFETAKLLKEKGFDKKYPLIPCYKEDNGEFIDIPTTLDTINYCFILATTLQMAMKWLREVHNIDISIIHLRSQKEYLPRIESDTISHDAIPCKEYEKAAEVAIKYCLEHLI